MVKYIKIPGTDPNIEYITSPAPSSLDVIELATTNWVRESYDSQIVNAAPVGLVIAFAANTEPEGFILCDGSTVSRETYFKLFSVIGTLYGEGDGTTTFALPNLNGRYIQGNTTSGTMLNAGLPEIGGNIYAGYNGTGYPNGSKDSIGVGSGASYVRQTVLFKASTYSTIYGSSDTVQPPSITMRYYIKY